MSMAANIKRLRELHNITQRELAAIVGVSDKAVWTWENETVEPRIGYVQALADHFGLPVSALIEAGGMDQVDPVTKRLRPRASKSTAPLYAAICAGTPIQSIEAEGQIPVPEHILEEHPKGFFLRVSGESMNRVLPNGSFAFVDPDSDVVNGDVAVVVVNGCDAAIKRVHRFSSSVVLEPDSLDDQFKETVFDYARDEASEVKVIGRVVWYVAPYGERL